MFFECQWLILFQAENICFLPPVALTQSMLKSVEIVLLTSKTFRSSPVPSVVYNFIVKYHRTGNICFTLFFLSFATLKKPAWNQDTVQDTFPNEWYQIGSRQSPVNSSGAQVQVLARFLFRDKGYFSQETQQPPCTQLASLWSANWGLGLLHPPSVTACPQQIIRPTPLQIQHWTEVWVSKPTARVWEKYLHQHLF